MGRHSYARHGRSSPAERYAFCLLFPVLFCYDELIFKLSTVGRIGTVGTWFTLIFALCYGGIAYLLTSVAKKPKINRWIAFSLMVLTTVVFLIEYFVYRQFKIYYDVNTVTGGAGGVLNGFFGTMLSLIFSFDGLFKIALFALPIVLFMIFGKSYIPAVGADLRKRLIAVFAAAALFLVNILALNASPIGVKYRDEYDFQDAVSNYGLLTGLRLDISNLISPRSRNTFVVTPTGKDAGKKKKPTEKEIEYGYNEMAIDFNALAQNAKSSKLKALDQYVSSLTPSKKNKYTGLFKGKNLIMISAEAFSAEVIDENLTPTLYRLATKGINFTDYYQPASAGTTGGEYQNLLGLLPTAGGQSFKQAARHNLYFSMGNQLNRLGYYGKAFHNNTYTFYDRHKTHVNLGYSDGYIGYGNGMEQYVKNCWPQSDLEMMAGTLPTYIDRQPFNVYYMSVSGHSGYRLTGNSMTKRNWDAVKDLPYSDPVKGYLAANLELEKALASVVASLEEKGIANDTVICISADHFPYGLDDSTSIPYLTELYGYKPENNLQRDHNRLILWSGCLESKKPIVVSSPTSSLDIVPTLSNLFGTEFDSRLLPGRDVFSDAQALVFDSGYNWKTDLGTYISSTGKFTPANDEIEIPEDYVKQMKTVVRNKINYCAEVLNTDYYAHVFG